jgi:hypothetical protein
MQIEATKTKHGPLSPDELKLRREQGICIYCGGPRNVKFLNVLTCLGMRRKFTLKGVVVIPLREKCSQMLHCPRASGRPRETSYGKLSARAKV